MATVYAGWRLGGHWEGRRGQEVRHRNNLGGVSRIESRSVKYDMSTSLLM